MRYYLLPSCTRSLRVISIKSKGLNSTVKSPGTTHLLNQKSQHLNFKQPGVTYCYVRSHHNQFLPTGFFGKEHNYAEHQPWKGFGAFACSVMMGLGLAVVCSLNRAECEAEAEPIPVVKKSCQGQKTLSEAIDEARDLVQRIKDEVGSPGLVVAVNVNGKEVWSEGLGYADVENRVPCGGNTVIRIASISKSMTMTIAGRLMEQNKLDLDKSVKTYVKDWPDKEYDGEKVDITTRQLVSHKAGVRHYSPCQKDANKDKAKEKTEEQKKKEEEKKAEFEQREYYLKKRFSSVTASLKLFKNDRLCFKPGTDFLYTSHGWTLISAVLEGASGQTFPTLAEQLFSDLGLSNTYLDKPTPLIYNRASNYVMNAQGRLENAPYVDNSYKWAGGGFLSTAPDLCRFGDAMLYSLQTSDGYLQQKTMEKIWQRVDDNCPWDKDGGYAMGWCSIPEQEPQGPGRVIRQYMSHTGGAVGASSVLLVMPASQQKIFIVTNDTNSNNTNNNLTRYPQGVTVAIAVNMQSVGLNKVALQIAKLFDEACGKD